MFFTQALDQAKVAYDHDEVPVGAVIVQNGTIIARSYNQTYSTCNPAGHAEILCLQVAAKILKRVYLDDCDLYVTLEPCPMCAQAISLARVKRLYFGAYDPKGGGVEHGPKIYTHNCAFHKPEVYGGIQEQACADLLQNFFKNKR